MNIEKGTLSSIIITNPLHSKMILSLFENQDIYLSKIYE